MTTPQLVSEAWDRDEDPLARTAMLKIMTEGGVWPSAPIAARDEMAGLYPDPDDPQFAARLYSKREFYEARAVAAQVQEGAVDPCDSTAVETVFELTPVQRLVSRFMHPLTPYMGLLLFHGVGVGKTCSGVTIAEQFLESAPNTKVILLVPQAIQENFKLTVFDTSKLRWSEAEGQWKTRQCTGTSYLERLGLLRNPDLKAVQYQVDADRRRRYTITGYQAFANWIERTLNDQVPVGLTDPTVRRLAENEVLRRLFSEHLIIIDEAHNMRDSDGGSGAAEAPVAGEAAENAGGKALNPYLKRIVLNAEGLRLVFMSATPMYNSAPEITLLLNYLLMNDAKSEKVALVRDELFTKEGDLRPGPATKKLEDAARRYVSYMRGENPYTFPLRMRPAAAVADVAGQWPEVSATKNPVVLTEQDIAAINAMPIVFTEPVAGSPPEQSLRSSTKRAAQEAPELAEGDDLEGPPVVPATTDAMLDLRMQMANITYPNNMYGTSGWDNYFTRQTVTTPARKLRTFGPKDAFDVDSVFAGDNLRTHAPKMHRVIESIKAAKGICFAYSRYIKAGALPMAIALERAGFQRRLSDGKLAPLLTGVPPVAPVCALCSQKEAGHGADHPFRPACYILLTSETDISPDFPGLIKIATTWNSDPTYGPEGSQVKVIIGSQVASEGLDLKCIREMHILDAWYHLNRTDQIIGRAIRYCSHTALRAVEKRKGYPAMALNNCLIYLHALRVPDFETADMYAYRLAIRKAQAVGRVQRLLKKNAWDCNLEMEAIVFAGLPKRPQRDAQDRIMDEYSIDDQDYTTYCDYQTCKHECATTVAPEDLHLDSSTFSVNDARRIIMAKQDVVRRLFQDQVMVPETIVQDLFADLPWEISSEALMELIDGRRFRLRRSDGLEGYLIKKAGYLVFQPTLVSDTDIPLSMRYARAFQMRRKFMKPQMSVFSRAEEPAIAAAVVADAKPTGVAAAAVPELVVAPGMLDRWAEWSTFVGGGKSPFPGPSPMRIWVWILERFGTLPETKQIALRWWFDKMTTREERQSLYEYTMAQPAATPADLIATLKKDIVRLEQVSAFRQYNPDSLEVEIRCLTKGTFKACPSNVAAIIDKTLGNKPVAIPDGVGPLFGFLAAKTGKIVFKTLDTTKPKKHSSVGAECGNTSNLGEHHPRIRMLHVAAKSDPAVAPLIIPDDDASWEEPTSKERVKSGRPEHMKDITHQPLCIYMEFLTRLLDARGIQGRRWFLDAVDASNSSLKGKK
jgi:hypothetical protein